MKQEVEVKILDIDEEKISQLLLGKGAKKVFDGIISDQFYKGMPKGISVLRVRDEDGNVSLSVKKDISLGFSSVVEEFEVGVSSREQVKKILSLLGFKDAGCIVKRRTSYVLNSIRFEFDKMLEELDFVPCYLEIEADSEEKIDDALQIIGMRREDCVNFGMPEVIEKYRAGR